MVVFVFFFFKQKTAYEIYQCDWSSDVCSSDLGILGDSEHRYGAIKYREALNTSRSAVRPRAVLQDRKSVV